ASSTRMPAHSHEHDLLLRVANRASGDPESHDQDLAARVVEPSDRSWPLALSPYRRLASAERARRRAQHSLWPRRVCPPLPKARLVSAGMVMAASAITATPTVRYMSVFLGLEDSMFVCRRRCEPGSIWLRARLRRNKGSDGGIPPSTMA